MIPKTNHQNVINKLLCEDKSDIKRKNEREGGGTNNIEKKIDSKVGNVQHTDEVNNIVMLCQFRVPICMTTINKPACVYVYLKTFLWMDGLLCQ